MKFKLSKTEIGGVFFYKRDKLIFGPFTKNDALKFIGPDTNISTDEKYWMKARDSKVFQDVWHNDKKQLSSVISDTKKSNTSVSSSSSSKKSHNPLLFIASLIFVSALSTILYLLLYKPYAKDRDAARMYSYASSLVLRSSPVSGVDYNVIGSIPYGAEILVYSISGEWAECKFEGKTGIVAIKFLLDGRDFHMLNGMFADEATKEVIGTTKCRKALLDYYKSKGMMSKIDVEIQKKYFGMEAVSDVWRIIAKSKNIKPNTVAFPRVVNRSSKFTDFACLITNMNTRQRRLVLFTFDEFEQASILLDTEAPTTGSISNINRVYNGTDYEYFISYAD
jgi:hypothetical protein